MLKRFGILVFLASGLTPSTATYATPLAPGHGDLAFPLPAPDTYDLPVIGIAADGEVLTVDNQTVPLHRLMDHKLVLLSFIYATCSDINGCPLATQVLHKISRELQKQAILTDQLRLLTISFNPEHDTPEQMRHYGENFKIGNFDWQFLTTRDEHALQPLLDGYQQNVQKIYGQDGRFTGTFSHLLRVYLIDKDKQIRNIYSVDLLHPATLINDIKNLLTPSHAEKKPLSQDSPELFMGPGDDKRDYQQTDYQTHSSALSQRQGQPTNLMATVLKPPMGLPKLPIPKENPVTTDKIALGRQLFFDRRLSFNNTFSCAMCHIPEQGFTNNEMATAVGIEGRSVRRNSPSLYNVGYARFLFHDGRENSLEQQAWGPLLAHNEMGNPSIAQVVDKLKMNKDYQDLFKKAFGKGPSMETIGQALASYQRTLNSADSAFDRWYFGKQSTALDIEAQHGFDLFNGKAGCSQCHTLEPQQALFSDQHRHNTGIGYAASMQRPEPQADLPVAPGLTLNVDLSALSGLKRETPNDLGYYEITQNPADRWSYKTPSLRNVALTAPYMHNGSLRSLADVVNFYNQGGIANDNLSPLIKPLGLSDEEVANLVSFLKSLTGSNVSTLVSDAFAAPIGELH